MKRNGAADATVSKGGVTAQKVRYLDLLLVSPWSVRVGPELGVPVAADVDLLVPNPTSFIVQKLLIHTDRRAGKRAQDILYIHDTLELFGASLGELHRLWLEQVRQAMAVKTARRAERIAQGLFADVTDTIREAARIPQDRQLTPENLQRACAYGLGEVLGVA
ncbi:MAG: GSU2403 family nucleotidyltransferase fold protein [Vicinamibacteria bacterium]